MSHDYNPQAVDDNTKEALETAFEDENKRNPPLLRLETEQGRTEAALRARYQRDHGDRARHVGPWRKWIVWDGCRWTIDHEQKVSLWAQQTSRAMFHELAKMELHPGTLKDAMRFVQKAQDVPTIKHALELLQPHLAVSPDRLDADPWLLNCRNGVVNLRTGEFRGHDPGDLLTKVCGTEYRPNAGCPRWCDFMREIFQHDSELIEFVQRCCGLSLVGEVIEHLLLLLYGPGANGKSVLQEVLGEVNGDYAYTCPAFVLLKSKNDRHPAEQAEFHGRRFVTAAEPDAGRGLAEETVKHLTGGDTITARRMKEDFWSFKPSHTIWLACNHKPTVSGRDHGIWRRLRLIPFNQRFDVDGTQPDLPRADPDLRNKLRRELPGILQWCLVGLQDYLANGLDIPATVLDASSEYQRENDTLQQFIDECCDTKPTAKVQASKLYAAYQKWCEQSGIKHPWSSTRFGREIEEIYPKHKSDGKLWRKGIEVREG